MVMASPAGGPSSCASGDNAHFTAQALETGVEGLRALILELAALALGSGAERWEAVKRNLCPIPGDFMIQVTEDEWKTGPAHAETKDGISGRSCWRGGGRTSC